MKQFIDEHREAFGVEPICKVLPIAPYTYYRYAARQIDPTLSAPRVQRDKKLAEDIQRMWDESRKVYGARKVWRALHREGEIIARCTVERLMRTLGLRGVRRGQRDRTTVSNPATVYPFDRVKRQFQAPRPNALWVADFTYVSTWEGFVYTAFVINVFARYIVGWKVSSSSRTDFVLDALEQALYARKRITGEGLIHHSEHGVQYVSIRYTDRLKDAGIEPSVGTAGDSYDNALAETINGLYKAEVIHRQSWKNCAGVELATLDWVHWFNQKRLLAPIGYIPPAEAEAAYYQHKAALDEPA